MLCGVAESITGLGNNVVNDVSHEHNRVRVSRLHPFYVCIKVSSLSAPREKQRAGGSLGRSALPWATYETPWMSVDVCRCVCVAEYGVFVYSFKYNYSTEHVHRRSMVGMKVS